MDMASTFIVPLLVALTTALVTSLVALRNFRRERMWDLKVETYDSIFAALYDFYEFFRKQVQSEVFDDLDEEELEAEKESYNEASYYLGSILFTGEFIIHPKAVKELEELNRNLQLKEPGFLENLLPGHKRYKFYIAQKSLVSESTDRLRIIAKKDLKAKWASS